MQWKEAVNGALARATGYQLARRPEQIRTAMEEQWQRRVAQLEARHRKELATRDTELARVDARRQRAAERREAKKREAAERRATGADLPAYVDDDMRRIIATVRPRTMTGSPKLQALVEATRHVVAHQVPGAVVECGVWRGGSMQAIALTLMASDDTERQLHLFDTFDGMSEPTDADIRITDGRPADELLAESDEDSWMLARAGLDDVREGMAETGYPGDRIHFHPGKVEDTIPGQAPEQIALLRLDTDWYESTRHELEHLYPRLSPGGILILDDFGAWEGARKATLEWLDQTGLQLFLAPMGGGRIAVKPPV